MREYSDKQVIDSLWCSENPKLQEIIEWAINESPEILEKVVEFAHTDERMKRKLQDLIDEERYSLEHMVSDREYEPDGE